MQYEGITSPLTPIFGPIVINNQPLSPGEIDNNLVCAPPIVVDFESGFEDVRLVQRKSIHLVRVGIGYDPEAIREQKLSPTQILEYLFLRKGSFVQPILTKRPNQRSQKMGYLIQRIHQSPGSFENIVNQIVVPEDMRLEDSEYINPNVARAWISSYCQSGSNKDLISLIDTLSTLKRYPEIFKTAVLEMRKSEFAVLTEEYISRLGIKGEARADYLRNAVKLFLLLNETLISTFKSQNPVSFNFIPVEYRMGRAQYPTPTNDFIRLLEEWATPQITDDSRMQFLKERLMASLADVEDYPRNAVETIIPRRFEFRTFGIYPEYTSLVEQAHEADRREKLRESARSYRAINRKPKYDPTLDGFPVVDIDEEFGDDDVVDDALGFDGHGNSDWY